MRSSRRLGIYGGVKYFQWEKFNVVETTNYYWNKYNRVSTTNYVWNKYNTVSSGYQWNEYKCSNFTYKGFQTNYQNQLSGTPSSVSYSSSGHYEYIVGNTYLIAYESQYTDTSYSTPQVYNLYNYANASDFTLTISTDPSVTYTCTLMWNPGSTMSLSSYDVMTDGGAYYCVSSEHDSSTGTYYYAVKRLMYFYVSGWAGSYTVTTRWAQVFPLYNSYSRPIVMSVDYTGKMGLGDTGYSYLTEYVNVSYDKTYEGTVTNSSSSHYPNGGIKEFHWVDEIGYYYYDNRTTKYSKGTTQYSDVTSTNRSAYPDNSYSGSYWYVYSTSTTSYSKGSTSYGTVNSTDRSAYPDNNYSGSYWYEYSTSTTTYSQGTTSYGIVKSKESDTYPANGKHTDNYWYVSIT